MNATSTCWAQESWQLETAKSMHFSQAGLDLSLGVQAGGLQVLCLPRLESEFRFPPEQLHKTLAKNIRVN